jgi:hypothetical protein
MFVTLVTMVDCAQENTSVSSTNTTFSKETTTSVTEIATSTISDDSSLYRMGESYKNPTPIGVTVSTTVEMGDVYSGADLYDVKITLREIIRGNDAWQRIKAISAANPQPKENFEYILAFISFSYFSRGLPGNEPYKLRADYFKAVSQDLSEYDTPSVSPPSPGLSTTINPGGTHEGWIVLQVPISDKKPFMTFKHTPEKGVYRIWNPTWFKLY